MLTHWGRVTHICVGNQTIIGSDNGLAPCRHQAIIWTNDGILLIRSLETNFSEILSKIHTFSFKKTHLKTSVNWRPSCLGLNVLIEGAPENKPPPNIKHEPFAQWFGCTVQSIIIFQHTRSMCSTRPQFNRIPVVGQLYMQPTQLFRLQSISAEYSASYIALTNENQ